MKTTTTRKSFLLCALQEKAMRLFWLFVWLAIAPLLSASEASIPSFEIAAVGFGAARPAQTQKAPSPRDTAPVVVFNSKPSNELIPSHIQDISGVWEGEMTNGNLIMYYQVCLYKISDTVYSGCESIRWDRNINHAPIDTQGKEMPNAKKTFIGTFTDNKLDLQELQNIAASKWNIRNLNLRFVDDGGTPVMINNSPKEPAIKAYLKRTGQAFPPEYAQYIITEHTLQIVGSTFKNSSDGPALKYNDHGQLTVAVKNDSETDLAGLQGKVTVTEQENGILNNDKLYGVFAFGKNSNVVLPLQLTTDFSVPSSPVHLNIVISYRSFVLAKKTVEVPTECFYRTADVAVPSYTAARMKAVSGFFGFSSAPYTDVSKTLSPLASSGDKMALMWESVFSSMGYGGYKLDEARGYSLGKANIGFVEDKARAGDAEAMYLLFYACQLGLEGEAARSAGESFVKKSAQAGFLPAAYDYALGFSVRRDYKSALAGLMKVYELGVRKSANMIGRMYERGSGVDKDTSTAMSWYKKGMDFGDPDAALSMANLYAAGFEDSPPDISKAVNLASGAAAKNCTSAMIFNGMVYFNGKQGIEQNIPTAVKWFKAGAELGDRQAMLALGETYLSTQPGVTPDEKSGLFWIKKAAELGSPKAMLILAKAYNEGTLGDRNVIIGRYWYNQAALSGYARPDNAGLMAEQESFMNFWKYADFSSSYIYVNEYGTKVGDADDGMFNGLFTGLMGSMASYYGNQHELIDGLEFICKRGGYKIYGGTVSSYFVSGLNLTQGQTVRVRSYGVISTGMMSGRANADGLGAAWPEYRIVKDIPCSAVMAGLKNEEWKFIGQKGSYTAAKDGPLAFALNAIDYRNYKGYFDLVVEVPEG